MDIRSMCFVAKKKCQSAGGSLECGVWGCCPQIPSQWEPFTFALDVDGAARAALVLWAICFLILASAKVTSDISVRRLGGGAALGLESTSSRFTLSTDSSSLLLSAGPGSLLGMSVYPLNLTDTACGVSTTAGSSSTLLPLLLSVERPGKHSEHWLSKGAGFLSLSDITASDLQLKQINAHYFLP